MPALPERLRRRPTTPAPDASRWATDARRRSWWATLRPPQLFALSFLTLIGVGTLGLNLLPGLYTGPKLSWLDALFTLTSAVCVTGLAVADTATVFTRWGQAWVLLFIQLGGLGIIAFTSLVVAVFGRRMSLRQEVLSASSMTDVAPHVDARRLIRDVVLFTVLIEAVGAVVLTGLFARHYALPDALWYGVFHSVSAFCNAGFSTFTTSLMGFQTDAPLLLVVSALIVAGGIGFLTIEEFWLWARSARSRLRFRLSLHSRIVLTTTAVLLAVGTAGGYAFEHDRLLAALGSFDRWTNAFFFSATARTAGFNSLDYGAASDPTNFLTILLMFVGGSPGSMAGGAKTTTLALLGLVAWARFRGQQSVGVWGRSVPQDTLDRATSQAMLAMLIVTAGILALVALEQGHSRDTNFLHYMFEAVSAFATVGLSMNLTPTLRDPSKAVLILLMFVGRVGPLLIAAALARPKPSPPGFRYAYEDVVVS